MKKLCALIFTVIFIFSCFTVISCAETDESNSTEVVYDSFNFTSEEIAEIKYELDDEYLSFTASTHPHYQEPSYDPELLVNDPKILKVYYTNADIKKTIEAISENHEQYVDDSIYMLNISEELILTVGKSRGSEYLYVGYVSPNSSGIFHKSYFNCFYNTYEYACYPEKVFSIPNATKDYTDLQIYETYCFFDDYPSAFNYIYYVTNHGNFILYRTFIDDHNVYLFPIETFIPIYEKLKDVWRFYVNYASLGRDISALGDWSDYEVKTYYDGIIDYSKSTYFMGKGMGFNTIIELNEALNAAGYTKSTKISDFEKDMEAAGLTTYEEYREALDAAIEANKVVVDTETRPLDTESETDTGSEDPVDTGGDGETDPDGIDGDGGGKAPSVSDKGNMTGKKNTELWWFVPLGVIAVSWIVAIPFIIKARKK